MTSDSGFVDNVLDLLSPWGGVSARRMFSGHGIYRQGLMFALVVDDVLYFKVDDGNRGEFEAAGMAPFRYERKSRAKPIEMSYYEAPPELFDDGEAMVACARRAFAASLRAKQPAKSGKSSRKSAGRHITKM
jgi:DNA transformation protein and related proteins